MASDTPPILPPTSFSRVRPETIERAVNALLKWKESKTNSQKPQLLPEDDFIYLILTLKKIPPKGGRTNPHKIPLPHPLLQDSLSSELCLIIDDRPKSNLTSESAKKKIKSENIPVSKVLKFSKLKTDYKPFEAKRKLCDSYDMFFADKRVIPLLPKLLGKQFFKKKKQPLPVDLTHKNWKEQIERGCSSALLYMKAGTCSVIRAGKVSMESGEIAENVVGAINGVIEFVPKKWEGVRSLHLKFSESLALPVYQAVPAMKLKIQGIRENGEEEGGSEVEVKEKRKKDGKLGKKKGRIHEVRYMDATVGIDKLESGDDGDEKERQNIEDDDLGSDEIVGKKTKKRDVTKEQKIGKMGKEGRGHVEDENESGESENGDLGSAEFEVKKKKGDSMKGQVLREKNGEKRPMKITKKGNGEEQKKGPLALKDIEESDGKKGKTKSDLGKTVKNSYQLALKDIDESGGKKGKRKKINLGKTVMNSADKKVKKSKKKQAA